MSLYNQLFGMNKFSRILLFALDIDVFKVERFRDSGVDYENQQIWVYARTGGDNRKDYPNLILTENIHFIKTVDDPFDKTYAIYYFHLSPDHFGIFKGVGIPESKPVDWVAYFNTFDPDKEFEKTPELIGFLKNI